MSGSCGAFLIQKDAGMVTNISKKKCWGVVRIAVTQHGQDETWEKMRQRGLLTFERASAAVAGGKGVAEVGGKKKRNLWSRRSTTRHETCQQITIIIFVYWDSIHTAS